MAYDEIGVRVIILGVGEARRAIGSVRQDLTGLERAIRGLTGASFGLGTALNHLGAQMIGLGRAMTLAVTTPLVAIDAALIKSGIDFEDHFAGVTKTVEGMAFGFKDIAKYDPNVMFRAWKKFELARQTGEMLSYEDAVNRVIMELGTVEREHIFKDPLFGTLTEDGKRIREEFRKLALEIPLSINELADVGELAGALGVRKNEIVEFTEAMAYMGVSTDLSAEDAANAIARLGNIMGIADADIAAFAWQAGSAIVDLGNKSAATESEIAAVAMRIAGAGRVVGLTLPEILGISTTLAEMGIKAEMGGTAVSRMLQEMMFAIADGGDSLTAFAEISGMSAEEFTAAFKGDAAGTMMQFMERLAMLQEEGKISKETLEAMGLSGVRVRDVINRLGPNMGELKENINFANQAWAEQIALEEEARKRFKTVASQLKLLKNRFVDLGITIFDLIRDDITRFIKSLDRLIQKFKNLKPSTQKFIFYMSLVAAAMGPLLIVFGTLLQSIGTIVTAFGGLVTFIPRLLLALPALVGGFGPLIAIAAALYLAWKTNFGHIQELVRTLGNIFKSANFKSSINDFVKAVADHDWKGMKQAVGGFFTELGRIAETVGAAITPFLRNLIKDFLGLNQVEYDALGEKLAGFAEKLIKFGTDTVTMGGGATLRDLGLGISELGTAIGGIATGDWDTFKKSLTSMINDFGRALADFPLVTLDRFIVLLGEEKGLGAVRPSVFWTLGLAMGFMALVGVAPLAKALGLLLIHNWQLLLFAGIITALQKDLGGVASHLERMGKALDEGDIGGAIKEINGPLFLLGLGLAAIVLSKAHIFVALLAGAFALIRGVLASGTLITALTRLKVILPGIGIGLKAIATGIGSFLTGISLPAWIAAGLVVGFLYGLQNNFAGVKDAFTQFADAWKNKNIEGIFEALTNLAYKIPLSALEGVASIIVKIGDALGLWKVDDFRANLEKAEEGLHSMVATLKWELDQAKLAFKLWLQEKFGFGLGVLEGAIDTNIVQPFNRGWDNIKRGITGDNPDSVKSQLNQLTGNIGNWIGDITTPIDQKLIQPFSKAVTEIFLKLFTDPGSLVMGLKNLPGDIANALGGLLGTLETELLQPFVDIVQRVLTELGKITGFQVTPPNVQENAKMEVGAVQNPPGSQGGVVGWGINAVNDVIGFFKKDAMGGSLYRRQMSLVGERGPELFIPNMSGKVVPAHSTNRIMSAVLSQLSQMPTRGVTNNNSSVYNPVFQTAPTPQMMAANRSMYEQWLMSGMGM